MSALKRGIDLFMLQAIKQGMVLIIPFSCLKNDHCVSAAALHCSDAPVRWEVIHNQYKQVVSASSASFLSSYNLVLLKLLSVFRFSHFFFSHLSLYLGITTTHFLKQNFNGTFPLDK